MACARSLIGTRPQQDSVIGFNHEIDVADPMRIVPSSLMQKAGKQRPWMIGAKNLIEARA